MPRTLVAFHAHPDDEALLTAGTMAKASAQGHRVVLVVATDGAAGLVGSGVLADGETLGHRRVAELRRSATVLGCARVELLGYADSGLDGAAAGPNTFAGADVEEAAGRLARLLTDEDADVLTGYDAAGGYGHPDHVQAHRVARRAAEMCSGVALLEATVPRELLAWAVRAVGRVYRYPPEFDPASFDRAYTPGRDITHRVDVRAFAARKKVAMAAHASQGTADGADRTLAAFGRLPLPLFRAVFGREWFVQVHRAPPSERPTPSWDASHANTREAPGAADASGAGEPAGCARHHADDQHRDDQHRGYRHGPGGDIMVDLMTHPGPVR